MAFYVASALLMLAPLTVNAMNKTEAAKAVDDLCNMNDDMVGCTLHKMCTETTNDSEYCVAWSLLRDICVLDGMGGMMGCKTYNAWCKSGSHPECNAPVIKDLPTTEDAKKYTTEICDSMRMDECACVQNGCEWLSTYSSLCKAMPGMSQCDQWHDVCEAGDITTGSKDPFSSLCNQGGSGGVTPGQMIMYFHTSIFDTFMLKDLTPSDNAQYAGACVGSFLIGFMVFVAMLVRSFVDRKIAQHTRDTYSHKETEKEPLMGRKSKGRRIVGVSVGNFHFLYNAARSSAIVFQFFFGYLAMLVVMSYNVGYFFCTILGVGMGCFALSHLNYPHPYARVGAGDKKMNVQGDDEEVAMESCCAH